MNEENTFMKNGCPVGPYALITGANGFMGSHMVELLLQSGYRVVATDIADTPKKDWSIPTFRYERCDLRDLSQIRGLLRTVAETEIVFHVAGLFDYAASMADLRLVNAVAVQNLYCALDAERQHPRRLVMWGAAGVYDFAQESPAKETSPTAPKAAYLITKHEGEMKALELGHALGIPTTIVRPGGVYGPGSRYGVAMSMFIAARGGMGPFYFGSKKVRGGMVHAIDVCRAAEFLANHPDAAGEIYNVGDDSAYTMWELTLTAAKHFGFPIIPVPLPLGIMRFFVGMQQKQAEKKGLVSLLTRDMMDLVAHDSLLDISKLKALGWRAKYPDAMEGLMETITWYEKEGWL